MLKIESAGADNAGSLVIATGPLEGAATITANRDVARS
jgi:hypothetical protein